MEAFIETFHIDWKLMLAQAINFGLVFLAFYLLAKKPLAEVLKNRRTEIEQGLGDAKKHASLLKETEEKYEEVLSRAKSEATLLAKQAKKESIAQKVKMLEEAKEEVAGLIEAGKKSLEAEKAKMLAEAKKEIVTLVTKSTEKVLGAKPDATFSDRVLKTLGNLK